MRYPEPAMIRGASAASSTFRYAAHRRFHGLVHDQQRPEIAPPAPPAAHAPDPQRDRKVVRRLLHAFTSLRESEAGLLRAEAAHFSYLIGGGGRTHWLGFTTTADLGREMLHLPERTARERATLHRVLVRNPTLERLFKDGKLTSCQILAIAPMMNGPDADTWIERARHATVRQLKHAIRKRKPDAYHEERHSQRRVVLDVPVEIKAAFHEFLEIGRKVIGYDAPPGEVVEAILAETGRAGLGRAEELRSRAPTRHRRRGSTRSRMSLCRPLTEEDVAYAEEVCDQVRQIKSRLAAYLGSRARRRHLAPNPHLEPHKVFDDLEELRAMHNPLRVVLSRLVRAMRRTRCDVRLGFDTLEDFVSDRLGLSTRLARELVQESYLFEQYPALERAYSVGRIGISKAQRIARMTRGADIERWIDRAAQVTYRAFERECRVIEILRDYDRRIARFFDGPFPHFGMERILFNEVCAKHRLTSKTLERELKARGVPRLPARGSLDAAKNRPLMVRLEVLMLLLCTSAQNQIDTGRKRQTFAVNEPHVRLGFSCSDEVSADLRALYRDFDRAHGPLMQAWVPFLLACKEATDIWSIQDPDRIPAREALLRRDEYHCAFPGCSRRRTLEVNHIRPRARGGSNHPENIGTLCFAHHREVFHLGHARITGKAPHALRFEIGIRPDGGPPLLVTEGDFIVERCGRDPAGHTDSGARETRESAILIT